MTKASIHPGAISRRAFLKSAMIGTTGFLAGCSSAPELTRTLSVQPSLTPVPTVSLVSPGAVVSIVKIQDGAIAAAVEEAIQLLGGVEGVAFGKERIMLKPNLVSDDPRATTKPEVIRALASLLKKAGKTVSIGEGSAAMGGFNILGNTAYRMKDPQKLDAMQQSVFNSLGYTQLAHDLEIPLVNLHTGEMVDVEVPGGLAYQHLSIHRALTEIDLLCSVPMMKTHGLATVTLGMKNLIGLYPGTVYRTVRAGVHDHAADAGSPGIAFEILDMVRANKLGLVVVDGSTAMEGNGPSDGDLVQMNVIIAGMNALATDMVAAKVMGFEPSEVPLFTWANKIGMQPSSLEQIEIRGASIDSVQRRFARPSMYAWSDIRSTWGVTEID